MHGITVTDSRVTEINLENNNLTSIIPPEIENLGSEITTVSADVTDLNQMKEAFKNVYDRYGRVNGVIHAATDKSEFTFIKDTTYDHSEAHFRPKVHGLYVLEESLSDIQLDNPRRDLGGDIHFGLRLNAAGGGDYF